MALSGLIAAGVQTAADDVQERRLKELARRLDEALRKDAMQIQRDQLSLGRDQLTSLDADRKDMRANTARQIDLQELTRRDRNNDRGLDLMRQDKADMDMESAIQSLPAHLKPIGGLFRAGGVGKLTPEDLEDPSVRAKREADARERALQDQIRVRNATREPRERRQTWVIRGGQPVPIEEGTAQPGDAPYDAVAARSSKPKDAAEAIDTAREAKRLATDLLNHKGFSRAFGVLDSLGLTLRQDTADAEIIRDSLRDMLTLENMDKMKGVLSDSDMKVVRSAATTLNGRMGDKAARIELQRIIDVMGRAAGDTPPKQEPGLPDGGDDIDALIERLRKPKGR